MKDLERIIELCDLLNIKTINDLQVLVQDYNIKIFTSRNLIDILERELFA